MGLGSDFMTERDYQQMEDVRQQRAERQAIQKPIKEDSEKPKPYAIEE